MANHDNDSKMIKQQYFHSESRSVRSHSSDGSKDSDHNKSHMQSSDGSIAEASKEQNDYHATSNALKHKNTSRSNLLDTDSHETSSYGCRSDTNEKDEKDVTLDTCSQSSDDVGCYALTETYVETTDLDIDLDTDDNDDVILAVFFEGTGNIIDPICTQIGIFAEACRAVPLSNPKDLSKEKCGHGRLHYKMAFDGCGVTNGVSGVLFGAGLDGQCDRVVNVVAELRKRFPQKIVNVVAVGQSRGGVACIKLVLKLSKRFDNDQTPKTNNRIEVKNEHNNVLWLKVSACLFDPVPGNALSTGFPFTAAQSMDLRDCRCLRRVLALYPYEPLPDCTFHAPCLPNYHPDTRVEEDVVLGCHQGALFMTTSDPVDACDVASNMSFRRLSDFFHEEGVPMKDNGPNDDFLTLKKRRIYRPTLDHCVELYRQALREHAGDSCDRDEFVVRYAHDRTGLNRALVRRGKNEPCSFLNRHHEQLEIALRHSRLQQKRPLVREDDELSQGLASGDNEDIQNLSDNVPFFTHGLKDRLLHTYQLDLQPKHKLPSEISAAPMCSVAAIICPRGIFCVSRTII